MPINENTENISSNKQKTKKITVNTLVLFLRMLVLTVVNLYSVKLVLNSLGEVDYGIYNAIAALVTSGTCISSTLAMSTQRYYSFAMGKGNEQQLSLIFSASLLLTILLATLIVLTFSLIGPWFINNYMTIPEARISSAIYVFFLSLAAFVFVLIQIPFLAAIFAHEDMGVYTLISTIDCLLKLLLAYFLYKTSANRLVFYGAGLMIVALITFLCYTLYAKHKYSECRYSRITNKQQIKELMSFSGWTFYGTMTSVVTVQGSALTLNVFFGPVINTAFTIGNQIYNAMNSLSGSSVIAFRPAMIKSFAGKDHEYLGKLFAMSNKLIFYLLLMLIIPLSIDTKNMLSVWLGEDSVNTDMIVFVRLYMIYTIILCLNNPITIIIQATGNIRNYTLAVESIMLAGLPVSICLFHIGMPPFYLMVSLIISCMIAHAIRLAFLHNSYKTFSIKTYITEFIIPAIGITTISSIITAYTAEKLTINIPLLHIASICVISTVSIVVGVLILGLTKAEKKQVIYFLSNHQKCK